MTACKYRLYQCEQCSYSAKRKERYDIHVKSVHEKIRDNVCEKCPFKTSYPEHLRKHIQHVHKGLSIYALLSWMSPALVMVRVTAAVQPFEAVLRL